MRFKRLYMIIVLVLLSKTVSGQQFHQSRGLALFNEQKYSAAIDTISMWASLHASENGIANYYIGESYYNLGLDSKNLQKAETYFRNSEQALSTSIMQTDMKTLYPHEMEQARYKCAWAVYRQAELSENPLELFKRAASLFNELSLDTNFQRKEIAAYMAGESYMQIAWLQYINTQLTENLGNKSRLAQLAFRALNSASSKFQFVTNSDKDSQDLRLCAAIRKEDSKLLRGQLYSGIPGTIYQEVVSSDQASANKSNPYQQAVSCWDDVSYEALIGRLDAASLDLLIPVLTYSSVYKNLFLALKTDSDSSKQILNLYFDKLKWQQFQNEKYLLEGYRDIRSPLDGDAFLDLADSRKSYFVRAGDAFPESVYWLAWVQFILNHRDSKENFEKFLASKESQTPRLRFLREDAQLRIFLLKYDEMSKNQRELKTLYTELEGFNPKNEKIEQQIAFLKLLVRIGTGEPARNLFKQANVQDRLDAVLELVRSILQQTTRVSGQERVPYLNALDDLFSVTQYRLQNETRFYRGLAGFLRAAIQETSRAIRDGYFEASKSLESIEGIYVAEADYVRARCYFAASIHEESERNIKDNYKKAEDIFIDLINKQHSVRSLYYLGEIYRYFKNDKAAKVCYDIVMKKTQGIPEGAFWYNNARAGLQNCSNHGDLNELAGIDVEAVTFPEILLIDNGVEISLERFADQEYIRRNFLDDVIDLMFAYGLKKRQIYPSIYKNRTETVDRSIFKNANAQIDERIGAVLSGLSLVIHYSDGMQVSDDQPTTVSLGNETLLATQEGVYEKSPIQLNTNALIRVDNETYYPYINQHRFVYPGVDELIVNMIPQMKPVYEGNGIESGYMNLNFERLDGLVLLKKDIPNIQNSELFQQFSDTLYFRDFAYSPLQEIYLATHSNYPNLIRFNKDFEREGQLKLSYTNLEDKIVTPEGIDIGQDGTIYIADWGGHRICVFNSLGQFQYTIGKMGINQRDEIGTEVSLLFPTDVSVVDKPSPENDYEPYLIISDNDGIQLSDIRGHYWATLVKSEKNKMSLGNQIVDNYGLNAFMQVYNKSEKKIEKYSFRSLKN